MSGCETPTGRSRQESCRKCLRQPSKGGFQMRGSGSKSTLWSSQLTSVSLRTISNEPKMTCCGIPRVVAQVMWWTRVAVRVSDKQWVHCLHLFCYWMCAKCYFSHLSRRDIAARRGGGLFKFFSNLSTPPPLFWALQPWKKQGGGA